MSERFLKIFSGHNCPVISLLISSWLLQILKYFLNHGFNSITEFLKSEMYTYIFCLKFWEGDYFQFFRNLVVISEAGVSIH